jgi:hypothetical protein
MLTLHAGRRLLSLAGVAIVALGAADAGAHFYLQAPAADTMQDSLGDPQKVPPCGGGSQATGAVTAVQAGQTLTITLNETIFHPGHYRVALAVNDPSELPDEPFVTPGNSECGSVPIMNPPVFPVLADGMLVHSSPFGGPQSFEVTLPTDVICDNCTLQVLEFMSSHGAPCFYHHCATLAIQEEPVVSTSTSASAGVTSGGATSGGGGAGGSDGSGNPAGNGRRNDEDGGCAIGAVGSRHDASLAIYGLLGLGALAARRRRFVG